MNAKKVYWAGDLFDLKDLLGNRMLADAVVQVSGGRWQPVLPQEHESDGPAGEIRDNDLEQVFTADAVVANFDGHDLDSGTVAEFCFAKFLDLPTVLLRTDFRNNNDPGTCADPWNLMCSGYPRTEVVLYNAMANSAGKDFTALLQDVAGQLVQALDRAAAAPPVYPDDAARYAAFKNAAAAAGGTLPRRFPEERIRALIAGRSL